MRPRPRGGAGRQRGRGALATELGGVHQREVDACRSGILGLQSPSRGGGAALAVVALPKGRARPALTGTARLPPRGLSNRTSAAVGRTGASAQELHAVRSKDEGEKALEAGPGPLLLLENSIL